jgi:hypothetical protein
MATQACELKQFPHWIADADFTEMPERLRARLGRLVGAGRTLDQMRDSTIRHDLGVRAFDRFCPADFFDSFARIAALEIMLGAGITAIADHDQWLVQRLVNGLHPQRHRAGQPG